MPTAEKTSHEILLEQLATRVSQLAAEQKAKEAAIKDLNQQIKLAEAESRIKIKAAQDAYDAKRLDLEAALKPLQGQRHDCDRLTAEIAALKQVKSNMAGDIRAARGGEIKEVETAIKTATARLNAIEIGIATLKQKVAGL